MLNLNPQDFSQSEWTDLVSGYQGLSLLQTWAYAEAKTQMGPRIGPWKVWRATFKDEGRILGAAQGMVRPFPWLSGGLVWINRGPLWNRDGGDDPSVLAAMMKELQHYWVEQRGMYLRIAPPALANGGAANALAATGCGQVNGGSGWASARVDLSSTVESLRSQLHQKWRNCLNKAERLGLTTHNSSTDELFSELMVGYDTLLQERKYQTNVTPKFISRLQALLPAEHKLWVFTARQKDQPLGGILIARYGDTCEYLIGSINEAGRALNAGQLLLWQAVCQMKTLGYRWFDLGGMDPEHTPAGIFHFKAGLGGTSYRLVSEYEGHNGGLRSRVLRWYVSRVRSGSGA